MCLTRPTAERCIAADSQPRFGGAVCTPPATVGARRPRAGGASFGSSGPWGHHSGAWRGRGGHSVLAIRRLAGVAGCAAELVPTPLSAVWRRSMWVLLRCDLQADLHSVVPIAVSSRRGDTLIHGSHRRGARIWRGHVVLSAYERRTPGGGDSSGRVHRLHHQAVGGPDERIAPRGRRVRPVACFPWRRHVAAGPDRVVARSAPARRGRAHDYGRRSARAPVRTEPPHGIGQGRSVP